MRKVQNEKCKYWGALWAEKPSSDFNRGKSACFTMGFA
jgi:hypothetical protein